MIDWSDFPRPAIAAHRGLSWSYPENTMPAYEAAIAAGPDLVEIDFQTTADGHLVCVHDGKLDRYLAGGRPDLAGRPIDSLTLADIRRVDVGRWKDPAFAGTTIPTLEEVIARFAPHAGKVPVLLIEHKKGTPAQLLPLLSAFSSPSQYVVQSFNWQFLKDLHRAAPHVPITALGYAPVTPAIIAEIKALGAATAHWHDQITTAEIALFHAAGLKVCVYTLNTELSFRGALTLNVDALTTDRCDLARTVLAALRK